MGNYLNKLNPNSSTASGSGDDGPSRIVQALIALVSLMLVSSVFAGGAFAHSASGVQADNFSGDGSGTTQPIYVQQPSMNASETATVTTNGSGLNYSDVTASDVSVLSGNVTVNSVNLVSDSELEITYESNTDTLGDTIYFEVSGVVVESSETDGQLSYTQSDGTTLTDSFEYTLDTGTSEPATGTVELGNISTYDNGSVDSVDVMIYNSSGDRVVNDGNITDFSNYSTELETGDYTYTLVADGYADADGSFTVSENTTTALDPSFGALQVDYDFVVENNGDALSNFTFNIYEGDSIGENESALSSAESDAIGSNTVPVSNLDDGSDYTVEIVYNDSDGNETTYTETITVDSADAENGTVSQTVDVSTSSDDGGFVGGSGSAGDFVMAIVALVGGAIVIIGVIVGPFAVLYLLGSGIRNQF